MKNLWKELQTKILNSTGFLVNLSPTDILLGFTVCNNNSNAINQIILVTKKYIYNASRKSYELRIKDVLNNIQIMYNEHKLAAKFELNEEKFNKIWFQMKKYYESVYCIRVSIVTFIQLNLEQQFMYTCIFYVYFFVFVFCIN